MNQFTQDQPPEEEIILNSKPNHLYNNDFGKVRFFQVVFQDETQTEIKLAPKTMLKVIYIKEYDDIEGFEIIKLVDKKETQKVKFNKFNFAQLKMFLSFISEIDLKAITDKRLKIFDEKELDDATVRKVKTLLSKEGGSEIVESLINEGIISSKDIVNIAFRKRSLGAFKNLLLNNEYWKNYAKENNIQQHSEEKVWQYFFGQNQWIFGYGLDYRYKEILQSEVNLSNSELDGSNMVISDFLLSENNFTTFVEIKKPSTQLFKNQTNRSNSWGLSNDLINSVSQILEHKASGQVRIKGNEYINGENKKLHAYDSKVILIIGCWQEIKNSNTDLDREIKKKTFELFRRDSRNIEILTFDELYERACFIVEDNST